MSRVRLSGDSDRIAVERAIAEIRMARPVLIQAGTGSALAAGVEELDPDLCVALDPIAAGRARIVLPASRLRRLELDRLRAGTIALPRVESERIAMLALKIGGRIEEPVGRPAPAGEDGPEVCPPRPLLTATRGHPV